MEERLLEPLSQPARSRSRLMAMALTGVLWNSPVSLVNK